MGNFGSGSVTTYVTCFFCGARVSTTDTLKEQVIDEDGKEIAVHLCSHREPCWDRWLSEHGSWQLRSQIPAVVGA